MKLAIIPPNNHLDLSLKGDILMVLANIATTNQQYKDFYKKQTKFKILDNGAAENSQVTNYHLITTANEINADVLVVPDTLYDSESTVNKYKEFVMDAYANEHNLLNHKTRLMIVPQGKTNKEYIDCLDRILALTENPNELVIGMSKFSAPKCFGTRLNCARVISPTYYKNDIHLLGMTGHNNDISELLEMKVFNNIKSNDSSIAVLLAYRNIKINSKDTQLTQLSKETISDTPGCYFDTILDENQLEIASHNISQILYTQK